MKQNDIPIKKLKKGRTFTLHVQEMSFGGKGMAKIETEKGKFPIFIHNTIPGQTVTAKIIKQKKGFCEAKLREVVERSPQEKSPEYHPIPGAPFILWPLKDQQEHKKQSVIELMTRIGKQVNPEKCFDTFIASPESYHYRNKMEYSFSPVIYDLKTDTIYDDFGLGFKHRGQWLSVENLEGDSGLFDAEIENKIPQLRTYFKDTGLPCWHPARHEGFYRHINFRKSFYENAFLVTITTSTHAIEQFDKEGFVNKLKELYGDRIAGVLHSVHDGTGDRALSDTDSTTLLYGRPTITEQIAGLKFEMSIQSFFQPNPAAAEKLYDKAVEYTLKGSDRGNESVVMDLFCGTGTIGQIIAHQNQNKGKVIGVDIVASAVENAQMNAERNGLKNIEFRAADVKRFLIEYPVYRDKISAIVLDPPRAGIAPKTLKKILQINAPRIVYISCNPASQARDMEQLNEAGYELKRWSVVDQFPHTAHVETVAVFE